MNSTKIDFVNGLGSSLPMKRIRLKSVLPLAFWMAVSCLTLSMTCSCALPDEFPPDTKFVQLKEMFPEMTAFNPSLPDSSIDVIKQNEKTIGYAFVATGKGYGGPINILVGLEDANTVKGVAILSMTEPQEHGSRIAEPKFTGQFIGKDIDAIKLKSEGGQIDGITGATISTKAVINAVRETSLQKVAQLPAK